MTHPLLLFIDLETSGLDPRHHEIFEIGAIVAEYYGGQWHERARLQLLHVTIRRPDECIHERKVLEMHTTNGLIEALVRARRQPRVAGPMAPQGYGPVAAGAFELLADGENCLLAWLKEHDLERPITAGFGVYFDRQFLAWHMPRFNDALHHRIIDVRTLCSLAEMTDAPLFERLAPHESEHRAIADCEHAMRVLNRWHEARRG